MEQCIVQDTAKFWDTLAQEYQQVTHISTDDFHYGPLLPGDRILHVLPDVSGRRCLEIGCGGGQNSIYLAKCGARCAAYDISNTQIDYARTLARKENMEVDFHVHDMDDGLPADWGFFDLIHSTYALPFAQHPETVLKQAAARLADDGVLVLTVGHPLYSGEWVECADGDGVWLPNYYHLQPETQERGGAEVCSRYFTIEQTAEWLYGAGLAIERILEPRAMPIDEMSREDFLASVPYHSPYWLELLPQLKRVPVVMIFRCIQRDKT